MRKLLFATILTFLFLSNINGQSRIGYTENEIRYKEFPNETFTSGNLKDGSRWISWGTERQENTYYFNDKGVCNLFILTPKYQIVLNGLVEKYNKEYVIVDDTHWKMYSSNGIIKISLIYPKEGGYFISFDPIQ
jgi:hypothetical protein